MATDSQAGSSGGFLGFSLLLSFRRNQVASMDTIDAPPNNLSSHEHHDGELVDRFQSHVARHLRSLLPSDSDSGSGSGAGAPLLSLPFLSKLLDVLVSCDREFYHLLLRLNPSSSSSLLLSSKPAAEFLDRSVRALDLCNAASAALLSLRHWRRQADVAASAAALRRRRALRRALSKLFAAADSPGGGGGGRSASARFLSKNWSGGAAAAAAAPGGMAAAACTMSCLLAFAAWALAAAVPFLDRGERPAPPRQMQWAAAMAALQERIAEECSQRRRGGFGVLAEVRAVETHARCLTELLDKEGTAAAAAEDELWAKGAELAEACRALEEGTEPLERQVRAVFHRVAATRAEVIRCSDRSSRCSAPAPPAASAAAASSSSSSSSPSPSLLHSF